MTLGIGLAGLALATAVVIWLGAANVFQVVLRIGWLGFFYVVAWQLAVYVVLGVAWWVLCPGLGFGITIWGRLVREGVTVCLPFSEIGGLLGGAGAVMLGGADFASAGASSIVDVACEGIGLAPFLLFGLGMVLVRNPGSMLALPMAAGIGLLLVGGFVAYRLRARIGRLLRAGFAKLLHSWVRDAPQLAADVQHGVEGLFHQRSRIVWASLVHVLGWCGGGGNVWIAYHLLGANPTVLDALAIESILSGVLAIGFLVPAGLGVQELTYVGVGHLFGLPADLSLALSLIRRARDITIGAPSVISWQLLEARALKEEA